MDFNGLRAFVAVAETGGFSRAADILHITQPAVSKRVAALEVQLDVTLFDRIGRNVQLTEAGRSLLPKALNLLNEVADAKRAISRLSGHIGGRLSIATSHHIGLHRLPSVLREYVTLYPDVELDLHFMDSEEGCHAVERGDLEMAIVTLPNATLDRLRKQKIWHDPLVVIVAHDHPLANKPNVGLKDIADFPAILPSGATYTHDIVRKAFKKLGVELKVRLETNYLETILMMVSIGLGWSTLPVSMLTDEVVALPIDALKLSRQLGYVVHTERTLSNAGKAMIELLEQQAK